MSKLITPQTYFEKKGITFTPEQLAVIERYCAYVKNATVAVCQEWISEKMLEFTESCKTLDKQKDL